MTEKLARSGLLLILVLAGLALAGCGAEPTLPPTATPTAPPPTEAPTEAPAEPTAEAEPSVTPAPPLADEGLLFSEVMPGIHGVDNNFEFIELYNAGSEAVDLAGWSIWYRLDDNKDEKLVYAWEEQADVPGQGHYLLARAGQDVGNTGDVDFSTGLFEKRGGLALRDPNGETVDSVVWGEGPAGYVRGSALDPVEGGASLERLPGGEQGNAQDSGDSGADFYANAEPSPQNSGDPVAPLPEERLSIRLDVPQSIEPGSEVAYTVEIQNLTGQQLRDVRAVLPLPPEFEVVATPEGGSVTDEGLEWLLPELDAGATETGTFRLQGPWTYLTTLLRGYYVESPDWQMRTYGALQPLSVEGGSIPIATARGLAGKTVTVEGIATMYTDGFYAGSTGTKFYLEDETGGIQAYCPGGLGLVSVDVGDRVRVTGLIEVYRDSVEIIPAVYPDDVEILEPGAAEPEPALVSLKAASSDERLLGRLIAVEGLATRNEEFSYSFEVDLMDDEGNLLLSYVEKDAGLSAELVETGVPYRFTGISELYDGTWQIKPRYDSDMVEIYPPELKLEAHARNSVQPGERITYTLTTYNHTGEPMSNVEIVAPLPAGQVSLDEILDGGQQEGESLIWTLSELAGDGSPAAVRYLVTVAEDAAGPIEAGAAMATADQWLEPAVSDPMLTFVGSGVPIWAIQGPGEASPYVRSEAATEGIVIGNFPGLEGFWIQEAMTDDDPATSAGLFVLSGELEVPVEVGDLVQVQGKVRERSGQTMLEIAGLEDVTVVSAGNELPVAVALDPPLDEEASTAYYEALEGMFVAVEEPAVAVGPTSKYGETPMVLADWQIDRVFKGDPKGILIFLDDGTADTYYTLDEMPIRIQSGDVVQNVAGPLAYTYENYKIEPLYLPEGTRSEQPLPAFDEAGTDQFSVATFNVENLFDPSDPHPSDPPIPTTREYLNKVAKTAEAIAAMGAPTIVGLQEVENIEILADLAGEEALAEYGYEAALIEGTDSRGIDVGYLVRGDRATLEGAAQYAAPEGLTSRPPLLITVTVHLDGGDETVYVLNNHFTSMSGGEKPTEPRRMAQAAWNASLVAHILDKEPEAHVIVLGDLNSFYESPPLDVLRQAGLRHAYEFAEPERPYTYIYQGESETLDHVLMTPGLYERLAGVAALHINADYPLSATDDVSARHVSDHDPLVVVFSFE